MVTISQYIWFYYVNKQRSKKMLRSIIMKRKIMSAILILCMGTLCVPLNGCGKKKDESTAIAITPTPSDKSSKNDATETPAPTVSADASAGISGNGTATPALSGISANSGVSANTASNSGSKITGTIVAASMEDVTVRTSEGTEYICSTAGAVDNLTNGITLGNNITVTLASMSAVNGVYTATELNDISSSTGTSGTDISGGTDSTLNNTYNDGTDVNVDGASGYDETYSDYSDSSLYDDGSSDYYYYDPASEIYDGSYS